MLPAGSVSYASICFLQTDDTFWWKADLTSTDIYLFPCPCCLLIMDCNFKVNQCASQVRRRVDWFQHRTWKQDAMFLWTMDNFAILCFSSPPYRIWKSYIVTWMSKFMWAQVPEWTGFTPVPVRTKHMLICLVGIKETLPCYVLYLAPYLICKSWDS